MVKTTLKGEKKWKWLPGLIQKVKGPLTYLVKIDNRIRYCHLDHLIKDHSEMKSQDQLPILDSYPQPEKNLGSSIPKAQISHQSSEPNFPSNMPSPNIEKTDQMSQVDHEPKTASPDKVINSEIPQTPVKRYPTRERRPPERLTLKCDI